MSVYFLQDSLSKDIKIGSGGSPKQRRADLQTGNPRRLVLLGSMPGGKPEEKMLHRQFAQYRLNEGGKEWFRYDPTFFKTLQMMLVRSGTPSTVEDELQRRQECRYGLRGVEVSVFGINDVFKVHHSRWNYKESLVLDLYPSDQPPPRSLWQNETEEMRQVEQAGGIVFRRLSDWIGEEWPDGSIKGVAVDQCVLLSEWPIVCRCWCSDDE